MDGSTKTRRRNAELALRRGKVVLWSLAMPAVPPGRIDAWQRHLPAEEQARADRFRFAADRASYVAAHALLRAILAAHGVAAPRFVLGPFGRPELALPPGGLRFSLTHTRFLVAAAVAMEDDIGIDVEETDARIDVTGLATRFFAASEAARLRVLPTAEQPAAFCRIWTLKEAFVKAIGLGLSLPLDSFAFDPATGAFTCDPAQGDPGDWSFRSLETPGGWLSVALRVDRDPGLLLSMQALTAEALDVQIARHPVPCEDS